MSQPKGVFKKGNIKKPISKNQNIPWGNVNFQGILWYNKILYDIGLLYYLLFILYGVTSYDTYIILSNYNILYIILYPKLLDLQLPSQKGLCQLCVTPNFFVNILVTPKPLNKHWISFFFRQLNSSSNLHMQNRRFFVSVLLLPECFSPPSKVKSQIWV